VGIVGHNGSGKSTLLKCICGVLQPTSGEIHLRGSLAALLELGAGFQPELSGRDNIFLYGAMLGFSKKMVDTIFDDVVEFSEIENFIDTQVKFYSSGMYVRLAFAVAVNVDPDILVVDEVLAVGDERFQAKCIDRIRSFQDEGRSILFVTHNADQVRAICDRAIVLDGGHMIADGPTHDSLRIFREHLSTRRRARPQRCARVDHHRRDHHAVGLLRRAQRRRDALRRQHHVPGRLQRQLRDGDLHAQGPAGQPQRREGFAGQPDARGATASASTSRRSRCSTGSTT
jgi:ABC-2 type transport system ATP-binding protein